MILSYFVIARYLASFLPTLPWHRILAEIADISAVSLLPLLLPLYEKQKGQKAQEESELASLYMPNTWACADRWENHRSDQSPSDTTTKYKGVLIQL